MGAALDHVTDAPEDKNHRDLKELQIARTALIKERTRLLNRSKTQTLTLLKRQSKARLAQVKHQLGELEEALLDLLLQSQNGPAPSRFSARSLGWGGSPLWPFSLSVRNSAP
jgi:transposase